MAYPKMHRVKSQALKATLPIAINIQLSRKPEINWALPRLIAERASHQVKKAEKELFSELDESHQMERITESEQLPHPNLVASGLA